MSNHNIGFDEEMMKIIFQLSSNTHSICSFESVNKFKIKVALLVEPLSRDFRTGRRCRVAPR